MISMSFGLILILYLQLDNISGLFLGNDMGNLREGEGGSKVGFMPMPGVESGSSNWHSTTLAFRPLTNIVKKNTNINESFKFEISAVRTSSS